MPDRPQLKTVEDLGMKPEKAKPAPPKPAEGLYHRIKRYAGDATYLPARQAGEYLTDAAKEMKK